MKLLGLILLIAATQADQWLNKIDPSYTNQNFDPRNTDSLIDALWSKVKGGVGTVGITGTNVGSETGQAIDAELLKEFIDVVIEGAEAALKASGGASMGEFGTIFKAIGDGKNVDMAAIGRILDKNKAKIENKVEEHEEKHEEEDQMKKLMDILDKAESANGDAPLSKRSEGRRKRGLALKERLAGIIAEAKGFAAKFQKVVDKNVGKSKEILADIGQQIEDAIDDIVDITPDSVKQGAEEINNLIEEIMAKGKAALAQVTGELDTDVGEVAGYSLVSKTKEFFQPHFTAIVDSLNSLGHAVGDLGSDALDKLKAYLATVQDKASVTKEELVALVKDKINDLNDIKDAVKQIINDSISSLDDPAQY